MNEIFKQLAEPLPYKWRVQSFSKNKPVCSCVAYIDSRDVMRKLDEVVGPGNWQKKFKEVKGNLFCGIGIYIPYDDRTGRWVWKWDCGTESNVDKEKGEASDSFKRAAVNLGVGRFLYDLPIEYVDANEKKANNNYPYPVDKQGKRIYDLTSHINGKKQQLPAKKEAPNKTHVQPKESKPASVKAKGALTILLNTKVIKPKEQAAVFTAMNNMDEDKVQQYIEYYADFPDKEDVPTKATK